MLRLILRSLVFYWRAHAGVFFGVALASAVLTGALLVGDSVDYSLRAFATMRLGSVRFAAETRGRFFSQDLASRLNRETGATVAAGLRLPGIAIARGADTSDSRQVNRVQVLGVDAEFWRFSDGVPLDLAEHQVAINAALASELDVVAGDEIALRIAEPATITRDAPLSERGDDVFQRVACTVTRVLSDAEMGRFGLTPSQAPPFNAFVDREWLQETATLSGQANVLLVGPGGDAQELNQAVRDVWRPEDIGLGFEAYPGGVIQLESDRVFFDPESARAAIIIPGAQGTLTYLVNALRHRDRMTPYSFMVAGPVPVSMADDEIVINRWLADEIGAAVGDPVDVAYYQLTPSNEFIEQSRRFTVHSVREMEELATEKDLMPAFPGLSDVERCADWDVGIPMDEDLLQDEANEAYWNQYRQTPKAFVTLQAGQEMWGNRFGDLTAVRYAGGADRIEALRDALKHEMDPARAGLSLNPVYEQAIGAVNQAMNFGGLFLGLSFFLIVAALMLAGLLHVFGLQQRAFEIGTLLALGFRHGQVRTLFLTESFASALTGAAAGAAAGAVYCRALIAGLEHFWQGAVAGAAIRYHAEPATVLVGGGITLVAAMAALTFTLWRHSRYSARDLLYGDFTQEPMLRTPGRRPIILAAACLGLGASVAIVVYAVLAEPAEASAAFFAAGALALVSALALFRRGLSALATRQAPQHMSVATLAFKNLARRSGRSIMVAGLLACGCFLVFAVSSMQQDLETHAAKRPSGTGGFALYADATIPLLENPVDDLRDAGVSATRIKLRDGDDASCLNLNRAQSPRLLGIHVEDMLARGAFTSQSEPDSVWRLLQLKLQDGAIPALAGDTNTAMWNLQKRIGVEDGEVIEYRDEFGNPLKVRLVGALPMRLSVFQGSILIADTEFTKLFPSEEGYRMFLIDAPEEAVGRVQSHLRRRYERYGLDVILATQRLEQFYAVESTYLAMFLVLGGLGLAVGSLGMGVVVLRNLLERRAEIAILRAIGFETSAMYRMLWIEYGTLLVSGLGMGAAAAAVAILPTFLTTESEVAVGTQLHILATVFVASGTCMALAIWAGVKQDDPDALRNE